MTLTELYLYIGLYFVAMIAIIILLKIRSRGLKALIFKPSGEYTVKNVKTEGLFLKFSKKWKPTFKPRDIFIENKPGYVFWRTAKRLVAIIENAPKALSWKKPRGGNPKNPTDKLLMELRDTWTLQEYREFAKKEAIQAQIRAKSMSQMQFIILAVLIGATLFIVFFGFNRMGVF